MIHRSSEALTLTVLTMLSPMLTAVVHRETVAAQQKGASSRERTLVLILQREVPSMEVWFSSREKALPIRVEIPSGVREYEISVPASATEFRVKYDRAVSAPEALPRKEDVIHYEVILERVNEGGIWETLGIKTTRTAIKLNRLKR